MIIQRRMMISWPARTPGFFIFHVFHVLFFNFLIFVFWPELKKNMKKWKIQDHAVVPFFSILDSIDKRKNEKRMGKRKIQRVWEGHDDEHDDDKHDDETLDFSLLLHCWYIFCSFSIVSICFFWPEFKK